MKRFFGKKILVVALVLIAAILIFAFSSNDSRIDYNTQVKPIFNKKCIACHGGVRRKARFSLLFRSEALANTESGKPAIIPGKPNESELIRRVTHNDPEERMPYKHDPLSDKEIDILRKWIKQGAQWGDHWAYVPVKETAAPEINDEWVKNDIDKFILEKLNEKDLTPSKEAEKAVLLRRVSLDLIGTLPSQKLAQEFLQSNDPKAYEKLVDSLLASPQYGERWTAVWLDLARYADTKGYEKDGGRNIWKYRDWLIKAFNEDKPYDQFLTEQIAGDLLPNPTDAQYIATAFHRNSMANDEGGTDNEEFRNAANLDRVNTTWEALMGTTFGCVQCHSHPYDPFHHEEYYNFLAFFNNNRDEDVPDEYPVLREFNDSMHVEIEKLTQWLKENTNDSSANAIRQFIRTWQPAINFTRADNIRVKTNTKENNEYALFFRKNSLGRINQVKLDNSDQLIFRYMTWKPGGILKITSDNPDGPVLKTLNVKQTKGWEILALDIPLQYGTKDIYLTYNNPSEKDTLNGIIMFNWFYFTRQFPGRGLPGYENAKKSYWNLLTANVPGTPIMMDNPQAWQRKTNVFERGNWLVKGAEVSPKVPNAFKEAMPANAPANRLGLTMWMTDKKNPLVSRTLINRLWEQLFGTGIVETLEDMGTQGIPPTHQELLDYLSWSLMNDYKWSIKRTLKEIVMSATYRQDSKLTDELKQKDLYNKYYARGPRLRLSSEQLRDQHLNIAGVLSPKMYGPSVMPWQPDGIWQSPYNGARWSSSKGEEQYRRALYTYWKRSSPYPSMIAFDGAQRNICAARRIRTNTPLQALTTLNDSAYMDIARHFAYRMEKDGGNDLRQKISKGYEWMLFKTMPEAKLNLFVNLYNKALSEFKNDKEKTCEMIGLMNDHNNAETAAMVVVANAMLNLDEIVTKN